MAKKMPASSVMLDRINAADLSRLDLMERLDEVNADHSIAKKEMDERLKSLLEALGESRDDVEELERDLEGVSKDDDSGQAKVLSKLDARKLAGVVQASDLSVDYERASDKFQAIDRKKRSLQHDIKKITEQILELISDMREGNTLFDQDTKAAMGANFRRVQLSDLLGADSAAPFNAVELFEVGEVIDLAKRDQLGKYSDDAELTKEQVAYLSERVKVYLASIGRDAEWPTPKRRSSKKKTTKKTGKKKTSKKPASKKKSSSKKKTTRKKTTKKKTAAESPAVAGRIGVA